MHLSKHHGLGNDFLVLLDAAGDAPVTPELVRAVCDRHRGIGADGFLRATPTPSEGVDARMELFNADGSGAEMSGNGIRCLGQALLLAGWTARDDQVVIATHAGVRTLTVHPTFDDRPWRQPANGGGAVRPAAPGAGSDPGPERATATVAPSPTMVLSVDMGAAQIGSEAPEWVGGSVRRAMWADMGNPHLVAEVVDLGGRSPGPTGAEGDGAAPDALVALGEQVNATVPAGANVHVVVAGEGDAIAMRTYERGVGLTEACGTGACAAAAVAHRWGLVGPSVTVEMPGGRAVVQVGPTVTLTGPATAIAALDYPWP